jgi:hypothetical protein
MDELGIIKTHVGRIMHQKMAAVHGTFVGYHHVTVTSNQKF